ncbi:MAG TPA: DUF2271 domain-containing protein, partial [Sphingobacteriaceae bacterium]|nr:DUF2271 domain-containing protein [Sphingobacteriaceae bacterium]
MRTISKILIGCAVITLSGAAIKSPIKSTHLYVSNFENVLGTSMEIKVQAASQADADIAENAAMNEIDRLNKILSAYDSKSEFSIWFKTSNTPTKVSPELFEVLNLFDKWRIRTGGALDASAEVVSQVWKNAGVKQQLPSVQELNQAIATVKRNHWKLDLKARTATHLDK